MSGQGTTGRNRRLARSAAPLSGCLGVIASVVLATGCGGDDSDTTTTASVEIASVEAVQACLQQEGLSVTPEAPTDDEMRAVLYVNVEQLDQVYVAFMEGPQAADRIAEGLGGLAQQAGGNAGAEVVHETIVVARARDTTEADVNRVTACLTE